MDILTFLCFDTKHIYFCIVYVQIKVGSIKHFRANLQFFFKSFRNI